MPNPSSIFYWVTPGELAGMGAPHLSPDRRRAGKDNLSGINDDLSILFEAGIRSVVSLIDCRADRKLYERAGFRHLCIPIPDFLPPTLPQMDTIARFVDSSPKAALIHCFAGYGRSGTSLAACLIHKGDTVEDAIAKVRAARPGAVESQSQVSFLHAYAAQRG